MAVKSFIVQAPDLNIILVNFGQVPNTIMDKIVSGFISFDFTSKTNERKKERGKCFFFILNRICL